MPKKQRTTPQDSTVNRTIQPRRDKLQRSLRESIPQAIGAGEPDRGDCTHDSESPSVDRFTCGISLFRLLSGMSICEVKIVLPIALADTVTPLPDAVAYISSHCETDRREALNSQTGNTE